MRVVCDRLGDPSVLKVEDVPIPEIGPADVLIKVGAASVNFPDVLMLTADYQHKPELPFIPGMEGAGTVSAVGADVKNWQAGRSRDLRRPARRLRRVREGAGSRAT